MIVDLSLNGKEFYDIYGRNKRVAMHTLGCKVNQYDTEAMQELFEEKEYDIVHEDEIADVYVINTCTVTNLGDRKSRQFIRRSKSRNLDAKIVVVGCYAQRASDEVLEIEGVNLVLGTNERKKIVELVENIGNDEKLKYVDDIMEVREFEELKVDKIKDKTRAYLKIQEGCNQFCTYCIIPYARGPIRSRQLENIVEEVRRLVKNGFKEVILTGIHIASYGKDLKTHSLIDVIKVIHEIDGLERIRLSSVEPKLLTEEFVNEIKKLPKFCNHLHLSLQSGCDTVLKRMNRKYTTEQYTTIVKRLRDNIKDIAITTDVIVGFPGETDEEFEKTMEFVKEIAFSQIHVFKFSPRKGTPAADFKEQIDGNVKSQRSNRLITLADKLQKEYLSRFINKKFPVLYEAKYNDTQIEGLTTNYIRVVAQGSDKELKNIALTELNTLQGDIIKGEITL